MALRIIDVIPVGDSSETAQDSEPSIAINPADPTQIIAGSFSTSTSFFLTLDGGATWSHYDDLSTQDKSLAWKTDGSLIYAITMTLSADLATYVGSVAVEDFGSPINT